MSRPVPPYSRLTIAVGLLLAVAPRILAQACRSGPVSLHARGALTLPPNSGIAGVATGLRGDLALWSSSGEVFQVDHARVVGRWQLPDSIRPVGLALDQDGLRLLDYTGREYRRGPDGGLTLVSAARLGLAEQLDQAVWHGGAWMAGILDRARRTFVLRRLTGGVGTELFRSPPSDSVRTIQRYHLTPSSRGLLLTRTTTPFAVLRLDPATGSVDTLEALLRHPGFDVPADSLSHWRALPAVSLDCTLLLTLTDLTADRRLLVRYGATDRVEQVTELDLPLGLITRLPGEDGVLAARRAGELELVWYDWHWVREPGSATP